MRAVLFGGFAVISIVASGCGLFGPQTKEDFNTTMKNTKQQELKTETIEGGLPKWITQCAPGLPRSTMCAAAESGLAATDVEIAKTEAEIAAKNRLADQLRTKVQRLQERAVSAMREISKDGKVVGESTLKDMNQNYIEQELVGLRYKEYFYYPNAVNPEKIFVLATLDVDDARLSQNILDNMMTAAMSERLEMKHEEAMARFDAVRKSYLMEEEQRADKDRQGE